MIFTNHLYTTFTCHYFHLLTMAQKKNDHSRFLTSMIFTIGYTPTSNTIAFIYYSLQIFTTLKSSTPLTI